MSATYVMSKVCKIETIYKPWSTERPADGQVVQVNLILSLVDEDDTVIENSRKRQKDMPFSFVLGTTDVIEGLNIAVRTFGRGERSKVKISSDVAYGESLRFCQ